MTTPPIAEVDLLLSSKSPRRRELLQQIGVRFKCISVDVPEQRQESEEAEAYVCRLAQSKAQAGYTAAPELKIPALGSDTIVVCDESVLEKPHDEQHAIEMLCTLAGRSHRVITAVALCDAHACETVCSITEVKFRAISEHEARRYWLSGEPADKAGAYGIQGLAAVFVESITGSYSAVVGLPLFETHQLLERFNVPVWKQN
ncbi:septum formation protein [Alteromonadaceae bacterium Bs31]|nr:septum formation protein [Alteromonadaceae bacterium Bs31]